MIKKDLFFSNNFFNNKLAFFKSKRYWIISFFIFTIVFLFNLPYLFVDLLDHDDGLWYYFASEGLEIHKFSWRSKIAILAPYRDWFYSNSMVYFGLPFTRGIFVSIMALISIMLFYLYTKTLGIETKVAFISAVIPNILPSLKGIPVGLNASYAMWGLLPILGSLLIISKAFNKNSKQSLFLFFIAFLLYAIGLNFASSANFLVPVVLLYFVFFFPNNRLRAILYMLPFMGLGLWQIYKQSLHTHLQPTAITYEVIMERFVEFFEMSSFIQFNSSYSIYISVALSILGLIGMVFLSPAILKKPDHFKFNSKIYRFLIILWPLCWIFSNSYAYIFKSPVFRAYDYAYVFNFGSVFLQISGIMFILTIVFLLIPSYRVKKISVLLTLGVVLLFAGYQRINNCFYRGVDSYTVIRESLSNQNINPETQLIILNTHIVHAGQPLVNSGHIRYMLNRNDIKAVIGNDRFPNDIFSNYRVWSDRMVGFDPEKPVKGFVRIEDRLERIKLMLQVKSTGLDGSSRLSWNLYDIVNYDQPVILASGLGLPSYFDYIKNSLPLFFKDSYIAFAPDDYFDRFLDKSNVEKVSKIDGLIEEDVNIGGIISLRNVFVSKLKDQIHLQLLINIKSNPGGRFKLSYDLDGRRHLVNLWGFVVEGDYVLITTPAIDSNKLKHGITLGFLNSGSLPVEKLNITTSEFAGKQEIVLRDSIFDQHNFILTEKLDLLIEDSYNKRWFSIRDLEFQGNIEYFNNMITWSFYSLATNGIHNSLATGIGWDGFQDFLNTARQELQLKQNKIALAGQKGEESKYILLYNINYQQDFIDKLMAHEKWFFIDCFDFDRSYIEPIYHFGYPEWTLNVWINPQLPIPSSKPFYRHYTIMEGEDTRSFLGINNTGGLTIFKNAITPSHLIKPGWNYITYSFKNGSLSAYINGVFSAEISIENPLASVKRRRIAQQGDFTHYYMGQMMRLQLWDRELSETEIQASMYKKLTGNELGLVGYWPLDNIFTDNGKDKTADLSPNKNHGIIVGNYKLIKGTDTLLISNKK